MDNAQGLSQLYSYASGFRLRVAMRYGVKQGYVLAPTLFGIFFAITLKHTFGNVTEEDIYLRSVNQIRRKTVQ